MQYKQLPNLIISFVLLVLLQNGVLCTYILQYLLKMGIEHERNRVKVKKLEFLTLTRTYLIAKIGKYCYSFVLQNYVKNILQFGSNFSKNYVIYYYKSSQKHVKQFRYLKNQAYKKP